MSRPRLWRTFDTDVPLFTVTAHQTWDDTDVYGMTLTRGSGDGPGVLGNTATLDVKGEVPASYDQPISVSLTPEAAATIGTLTNTGNTAPKEPRWYGRIGKQTVNDQHGRRTTQLQCADWLTEVARADVKHTTTTLNADIGSTAQQIILNANLPAGVPNALAGVDFGKMDAPSGTVVPWSDVAGVFTATAGNVITVDRDGTFTSHNLDDIAGYVNAFGDFYGDKEGALLRSQCRAPASWEQPTSSPAVVKYVTPTGTKTVRAGTGARPVREKITSTAKLALTTARSQRSLDYSMDGYAHRLAGVGYTVREVTVDLLRLLSSDLPADKFQANNLLTRDPFSLIALGHDWPPEVAGVYVIQQITDQITRDSWDVTLNLLPVAQVTGQDTPVVAGTTWDSAHPSATTWTAPTTTWDTTPA